MRMTEAERLQQNKIDYDTFIREQRQKDYDEKYVNSWRLTCDGVVIDHSPSRYNSSMLNLGDRLVKSTYCQEMLQHFMWNIEAALNDKDWTFEGHGGKQTAAEWLAFQENRLGVKLTLNLEINPPGEFLPLCPLFQKRS